MRYSDIIGETELSAIDRDRKAAKARDKIATAQRKKADAAQKYQDALRSANASQSTAQSTLREL